MKTLRKLNAPVTLLESIMQGVACSPSLEDAWRRISKLWQEAFFQESMAHQRWADKRAWSAGLVQGLLDYSLSLWAFRCALLHGHSKEESHQKFLLSLQQQVTAAYQDYADDPFIVAQNLWHIFYTPLSQHLLQVVDSLKCFLSTYEVALEQQKHIRLQHTKAAQQFFLPQSLLTVILQHTSDEKSLIGLQWWLHWLWAHGNNLTTLNQLFSLHIFQDEQFNELRLLW